MNNTLCIDSQDISFESGQSIMQAACAAGVFIPHLCFHPDISPHGSCRLCMVQVDGRLLPACTTPAMAGQKIENNTDSLNAQRRLVTQMLFVEGDHICPGCEKTGNCQLQAVAYFLGLLEPGLPQMYPTRNIDASHADVLLDFNRCILCELCVRASREMDGKNVFAIGGRGQHAHIVINATSGRLKDSALSIEDRAVDVCPVGALMKKHQAYQKPIGQRFYDQNPIDQKGDANSHQRGEKT